MKSILITGANRGIGKEIASQMSVLGWKVWLGSRDLQLGVAVADELGENVTAIHLDVTNGDTISNLTQRISSLDVLINNAGIFSDKSVMEFDIVEMRQVLEVNLWGVIAVTKELVPLIKSSNDGRIVNLSSGMGALADLNSSNTAYRLSKASLNAYTKMLASGLDGSIKVNAMCPGWVKTDMGGSSAPRSVEQGADTAVWLATADNIPHGKFIRDRKVIPW